MFGFLRFLFPSTFDTKNSTKFRLYEALSIEHEGDRQVAIDSLRLARQYLHSKALSPYIDGDDFPPACATSDEELLACARERGGTAWHFMGTCRMGPASDPASVVDASLRVIGLQNLRVVDASIMPNMPSGNTGAPTMMIAEKAADLILGTAQ